MLGFLETLRDVVAEFSLKVPWRWPSWIFLAILAGVDCFFVR